VGTLLGVSVVGTVVGSEIEGGREGLFEGVDEEGADVGLAEGVLEGCEKEGELVGLRVGPMEGDEVAGFKDGAMVGSLDGLTLGLSDGFGIEGEQVGESDGKRVG